MLPLFDEFRICNSTLFVPLTPNSTVTDILRPCLAYIFFPAILAAFSFSCLLFLIFYGFIIVAPKLKISKLLIAKCCFILIICVSNLIKIISILFKTDNVSSEVLFGGINEGVIALQYIFDVGKVEFLIQYGFISFIFSFF
jgi:hypothetical protein